MQNTETFKSPYTSYDHQYGCIGTQDNSCIASICSEIRAYTVGGCKGKTGEELKECLKGRVPLSSEWFCKDKDMDALIEKYFDSCLEHYPH